MRGAAMMVVLMLLVASGGARMIGVLTSQSHRLDSTLLNYSYHTTLPAPSRPAVDWSVYAGESDLLSKVVARQKINDEPKPPY